MENNGKTLKDVVDDIMDIRHTMSEKIDKTVDVGLFRKASEKIFEFLKEEGFTITDVVYEDGYFIFGSGTDSVVQYHVSETPGFLYGMWFSTRAWFHESAVYVQWFCQWEEDIDKFKPSRSAISAEEAFDIEKPGATILKYDILDNMRYIKQHPELAWYRDANLIDYNTEYVSEETAKYEFSRRNEDDN